MPHDPQMPSRQSCSKWIGGSPLAISSSLTMSSISSNEASGEMFFAAYVWNDPAASREACRHTCSVKFIRCSRFRDPDPERSEGEGSRDAMSLRIRRSFAVYAAQDDVACCAPSLVAPRGELHFFVIQRFSVEARLAAVAGVLPRGDVE